MVAEYYPRAADPVLGVWAHRQALAARDAGVDVRVLVLHRPIPPKSAVRRRDVGKALQVVGQPRRAELDGIEVDYVRYLSPPRSRSYASWGAWAAPAVRRALKGALELFRFDLVHAHYTVPAGDAIRRVAPEVPLIVSVHSHDPLGGGGSNARMTLGHASLTIANSAGTAKRCAAAGARHTQVVHLGTDVPVAASRGPSSPTLITVAHLIKRKGHADVISAIALLRGRHPGLRYAIVGDGPEREPLRALAASLAVETQVEIWGQLPPARAIAAAQSASIFVMPSTDEAFGVAYLEAMAAGVPAIGCWGEDGPEEIAASGGGIVLVPPRDPDALAVQIDALLTDPATRDRLGREARTTVERAFTWSQCGRETLAAYSEVQARGSQRGG